MYLTQELYAHIVDIRKFFLFGDLNRISVGANRMSRCLLVAPWVDLLFTSACQQHTRSKNMSMWWSCTFHLIVFCHTHSLQKLWKLQVSVVGGKDFSVQCRKLIFTATNQPNWFSKTWDIWNAKQPCLGAKSTSSPVSIYIKVHFLWRM